MVSVQVFAEIPRVIANSDKSYPLEQKPLLRVPLPNVRGAKPNAAQVLPRSHAPLRIVGEDWSNGKPQVLIEFLATKKQDMFSESERVIDGITIYKITRTGIELNEGNSQRTFLPLQDGNGDLIQTAKPSEIESIASTQNHLTLLTGSEAVRQKTTILDTSHVDSQPAVPSSVASFSEEEVQQILNFSGAVISETAPIVAVREGKIVGVQLSLVDPQSIAGASGFLSNDIVVAVNGTRITDPYQIADQLHRATDQHVIFDVERSGKSVTIEVKNSGDAKK